MKKITLLLVVFLALGGVAFAQQDVTLDITGDVTAQWGVNLDTFDHGFKNSNGIDVTIIIGGGSTETEGDGWYGYVEVTVDDLEIDGDDGADLDGLFDDVGDGTDVSAKITNDVIYVTLTAGSDTIDYAGEIEDADDWSQDVDTSTEKYADGTISGDAGIIVGIDLEEGILSSASLEIISDGDWDNNTENNYGLVANVGLALTDGIDFDASAGLSAINNGLGNVIFGVKPSVELGDLELYVAADGQMSVDEDDTTGLLFEAAAGIDFTFVEDETTFEFDAYLVDITEDSTADVDLYFNFEEDAAAGLIDVFGFGFEARVFDIVVEDSLDIDINAFLSYSDAGLGFKVGGGAEIIGTADPVIDAYVNIDLDSDFHGIDNTNFSIDWATSDLTDEDSTDDNELGDITIGATISL